MTRRKDPRSVRTPVPRDQLPAFEPVPRKCNRHDGWTPDRQRAFIEGLADTGSVAAACRAVNMTPEGAYHLRRQPGADSFRAAWAAALDCGVTMLEDKVMERAIHGVEVPVLSCGKQFGTRRVYNERVAMLILQARLPGKYGMQTARAMNGLDKQVLARKKREWRREWEAEAAHKAALEATRAGAKGDFGEFDDEDAVYASIEDKLTKMAERDLAHQSPATRALHAAWQASRAEDIARGFEWWCNPKSPFYEGGAHAAGLGGDPAPFTQAALGDEGESEEEWAARALPPPGWGERVEEEPEPEERPRWRGLKDEGW